MIVNSKYFYSTPKGTNKVANNNLKWTENQNIQEKEVQANKKVRNQMEAKKKEQGNTN